MANALQKTTYSIDKPLQMAKLAVILKGYIVKNNLYTEIRGAKYVHVEGWQFAGGMMGLFPRITDVEMISPNKWKARAEIIDSKTQNVVSIGYAICSKEEYKKKDFDEYAILSMAQTRVIGKAYRNVIGWVMKFAGYEGTPAEEMKQEKGLKQEVREPVPATRAAALLAGKTEIDRIMERAKTLGLTTERKIENKIGITVDFKSMTKKQSSIIYFKLLELKK